MEFLLTKGNQMCKVHKMVREVIGAGKRFDGDAYLPHVMTTELDHDAVVLALGKTFKSYLVTLLLKSEIGLDDVFYYWYIVKDPNTNDIIGAAVVKPYSSDVHYIDFHTAVDMDKVMHYMKQEHHFHTKIAQVLL